MANVTGQCILCNREVTEEDHRREIDCPSKTCPGRVYHEDCIAAYLRRTKYSKDRCTGFPCPAILATGKQCPGYVCKMHTFFPANQKKKQARLDAALAAAAAPKLRPTSLKPKAGAQVAIAAMKRATPEGVVPNSGVVKAPKLPLTGGAIVNRDVGAETTNSVQEPRFIPGLDPDEFAAPIPRSRAAKLKAQVSIGDVQRSLNDVGGVWPDSNMNSDINGRDWPPHATVWDALAKAPDMGGDLNYFDLERNNSENGGQFSVYFRKRLLGGAPNEHGGTKCKREPLNAIHNKRSAGTSQLSRLSDIINYDAQLALSHSPETEAYNNWQGLGDCAGGTQNDTTGIMAATVDQDDDPVVEYDMLYGADDGSYLVLDALANAYFRLVDIYGASPELVECAGEDGQMYTCVVVHKSQLEVRARRQQAWLEALEQGQQQQQVSTLAVADTTVGAAFRSSDAYGTASPRFDVGGSPEAGATPVAYEEEEDTDVASLMQLLGVAN